MGGQGNSDKWSLVYAIQVDLLNPKVEFFIVGYYGFDTSKGFYFPLQFAFFTRKVKVYKPFILHRW